jgi:hypothetical protein
MSEKFTPGPWTAVPTTFGPIDIVLADGRDVVTVYGGGTDNKKANAHLIAAAPELYEALQITMQRLDSANHDSFDGVWLEEDFARQTKEARAALAKARGET